MDSEDKFLKDIFSDSISDAVPFSFVTSVNRKIEIEKVLRARRESRREIMTQVAFFMTALAILIAAFIYIGKNYFDINFTFSAAEKFNLGVKSAGLRMREVFLNPDSIIWYVIAINTALLVVLQQVIQKKPYTSEKKSK
ncbi:MAG TPA: hypothetical protein DF637_03385 [Rikenellaceae bacterium]|nr:hypothetical protein [Rikenellaceae bacterium]